MEGRGRDPLKTSKKYLFIHVCRVRNSPGRPDSSISVVADLGSHTIDETRPLKKSSSIEDEWDAVIALPISDDPLRHSNPGSLEIRLLNDGHTVGSLVFDNLSIDPIIDTTKSPAPQWYKLWHQGKLTDIELLLSTWFSTNQHEAFRKSNLWHSAPLVYIQPNLWYLRISFTLLGDNNNNQESTTRIPPTTHITISLPPSPLCTLNLLRALALGYILIPAAEPLQTPLHISIFLAQTLLFEKRVPMSQVHKRTSPARVAEDKMFVVLTGVAGLRLVVTLEGGYHFFDEQARNSSDFRPTAPILQPPSVAHLDVCFKEADFLAMEPGQQAVSSPYCVAKYGGKWARTSYQSGPRPLWDDEFSWSVYDPCTVITIGVFDKRGSEERRLGKLRVRLSTMRSGHSYDQSFALWVLTPHSGMVNTGFIRLCMRLTPVSWFGLLTKYWLPLWPRLHYEDPLQLSYVEIARLNATVVIAEYMERAEPPLPREVVRFMLKGEPKMWVGRKTRSLQRRLGEAVLPLKASVYWLSKIRRWNNVLYTTCVVVILLFIFYFPDTIPYVGVMGIFILAVWNYCFMMPVKLPGINPCLSLGRPSCCHGCNHEYMRGVKEVMIEDEVDPFRWVPERVRFEDEREILTRVIFGDAKAQLFCFQELMEAVVEMMEKVKSLISWRDQRATAIFMAYLLAKVGVQYWFSIPLWGVLWIHVIMLLGPLLSGILTPSIFVNFFRRLPTRCDTIL